MPIYNKADFAKYKEIIGKTFEGTDYPVNNFGSYLTDLKGFVPLKTNGIIDGLYLINREGFVYSIKLGRIINWTYFNGLRSIVNAGKINVFPRVPLNSGVRNEATSKIRYKYFFITDLILETFNPKLYKQYIDLIEDGYNVKIKPKDGDYLNTDVDNLELHHLTSRNKKLKVRNRDEKQRLYFKDILRKLIFINTKTKKRKKFLDVDIVTETLGISQNCLRNSYVNGKLFKRIYKATWLVEKVNS